MNRHPQIRTNENKSGFPPTRGGSANWGRGEKCSKYSAAPGEGRASLIDLNSRLNIQTSCARKKICACHQELPGSALLSVPAMAIRFARMMERLMP
jgi:hypothetical protein